MRRDALVNGIVFGQQDVKAAGGSRNSIPRRLFEFYGFCRNRQQDSDAKGAARPRFALEFQLAGHHGHQLPTDCQAKAGSAISPGGGAIGLSEGLEDSALRLPRYPDASVFYGKAQAGTAITLLH